MLFAGSKPAVTPAPTLWALVKRGAVAYGKYMQRQQALEAQRAARKAKPARPARKG